MLPADIERHSAEVAKLLKDASYKRVDVKSGGYDAYSPGEKPGPTPIGPFTFVWGFSWTPQIEPQRQGWEALIQGFKLALAQTHPNVGVANVEVKTDNGRLFPLALAQIYAKMRRHLRGPVIYIEVDVVANAPCNPFEGLDFDIGLTDCEDRWPMMPFNAGVIFANDTPGAQRFLDTAMEYTCAIPQNFDPWYAYQFGLSHAYLALKDEVKIKIFPHEMYNYTPRVYAPTDAYFVHLKGGRKALQREYVVPLLNKAGPGSNIIVP